ncbi:MAG: carbonic anhydrase [Planctomycetia bacterium]|jgi:carbonic anhydrase
MFPPKPTPQGALEKLKTGNQRFVNGENFMPRLDAEHRMNLAKGKRSEHVLATVVGCSDCRVTPEFIFHSDPGDLFVIRTAGFSCLSDESLASVDFGVVQLESPLLIVLGHTDCKAVQIALQKAEIDSPELSLTLKSTILKLADSLEANMRESDLQKETWDDAAVNEVIKQNAFLTIERILEKSSGIQKLRDEGKLLVVPALYQLESGLVEWL